MRKLINESRRQGKLLNIYLEFRERIWFWAYKLTGNQNLAEDIAYEVFRTIAQDELLDYFAKAEKESTVFLLAAITKKLAENRGSFYQAEEDILVLKYVEGLDDQMISRILNMDLAQVQDKLQNGVKQLNQSCLDTDHGNCSYSEKEA